jgi:hypothetical protein
MRSSHDVHDINAKRACHVCLSAWFNKKTAGQNWIQFGMDIMTLVTTLKSYFYISHNR